jgi:hypothetical protein
MDSHYRIQQEMHMPQDSPNFNMHEFNIIEDGRSALTVTSVPAWGIVETPHDMKRTAGWLMNQGFQETDLRTNKVLFAWKSLDHIDVRASRVPAGITESAEHSWDWL